MQFSTPLLRAINLSIAVLVAAGLGGAYWFAWRTLPEVSGELRAPVSAEASIIRDAAGVVHITAAAWEDAIFLQGYATAQDRMWQMDALRRLAAGELAEVAGASALEGDREARRLRLPQLAARQEQNLTPAARSIFTAYARGVNHYLETHAGRLPVEFTILNYHPRPWRVRDTLLIGLHMYRALTTSWRSEIQKLHMILKGDPAKVAYLYPPRLSNEAAPGSNAWAVAGARTATGKAILATDPHLEFSLPSPWYLVHLTAPGLNVTGASLPGVPAVLVGHNERIAWGAANLEFDLQDLFRERIDAQTGAYVHQGRIEQARLEREAVPVKGSAPAEMITLVTRNGPLLVSDGNESYTLHWMAEETDTFDFPFLDLNRAGNWEEFNAALRRFTGPAQNFVYADIDGNIGYHVAGPVPVREGCGGDIPADGTLGTCRWTGTIPYDELPHVYNPESGIIVSANQNPFPAGYKYPVAGVFAPPYRAEQIRARLESRPKWTAREMLAIQKDVYSPPLHFLAQEAARAWEKHPASNEQSREAIAALREWDGQMERGPAPVAAMLLYEELRKAAAKRASPDAADNYASRLAPSVIERLLRERPPDWFSDYDELLVNSLAAAIREGERALGSRVARWDWGAFHQFELRHPVLGGIPVAGRFFNLGPVPISGSPFSVKQITPRLGPSFRMVVDFSDLDASLANILTGQSGHVLSRHYKDQWPGFYNGDALPMQFRKVDATATLTVAPE